MPRGPAQQLVVLEEEPADNQRPVLGVEVIWPTVGEVERARSPTGVACKGAPLRVRFGRVGAIGISLPLERAVPGVRYLLGYVGDQQGNLEVVFLLITFDQQFVE